MAKPLSNRARRHLYALSVPFTAKLVLCIPVICLSLLLGSCRTKVLRGEGKKTTTEATTTPFNAVEVDVPLRTNITMQEGSHPGIQLSGYENVISHIKTKVENNTLHIYSDLDETWEMDCDGVTADLVMPSISALSLEGIADAHIHGNITGPEFKLEISGAGKSIIDNINVDDFSVDLSGAAVMEVKGGAVKKADYDISGVGKIKAFPLQATETTATISGAGKGEITATQKLTASISGAGTIKYKGHPSVTKEVSGAGSVAEAN